MGQFRSWSGTALSARRVHLRFTSAYRREAELSLTIRTGWLSSQGGRMQKPFKFEPCKQQLAYWPLSVSHSGTLSSVMRSIGNEPDISIESI